MFQCIHCDEEAMIPIFLPEDSDRKYPFCCQGCSTVYQVLKEKSLSAYYDIKNTSGTFKRRSPVGPSRSSFTYLDDGKFQEEHCYRNPYGERVIDFYLEGIHCLACLWLIEKLPEIVPGVSGAKLDLEKSVVSITIGEKGSFSLAARELDQLGYRPHALNRNEDSKKLREKEERSYLKRLGVAGAAAGNIMIYSFSLYGGADESIGKIFNVLTVVLAIPVFTYSAWPFYQSAWTAMKNHTISIDIPISMALIMGAIMGVRGIFHGFEENYFDSLTALVFLLLLSRYFLRKIQDKGLSASDLHYFYHTESVLRKNGDVFEEVHSDYISLGDVLKIEREGFIPADGTVIEGDSLINNSLLTGESLPERVKAGHKVSSGTQNVGSTLIISVGETNKESRLGKILRHVEQGWAMKSRTVDLTSEVARYFTLAVILFSVLLFFSLLPSHGIEVSLTRALTLLIVTCPCALAISVPLTFHRSLSLAARNGVIVKSDEVFEKLARASDLYLDKTGTITLGQLQVGNFSGTEEAIHILYSLELQSRHPVARALSDFCLKKGAMTLPVTDFREIPGKGVEGRINGAMFEVSGGELRSENKVHASFEVRDGVRRDSPEIISRLQDRGYSVSVLSGDKKEIVKSLASEAGITPALAYGAMTPEEKVLKVKDPGSVMVGDGANDAMALESAGVGIAVSGAMDIALRASDVYLTTPGLSGVENLLILSQETMRVVRRNLILSLIYNSASVIFVFTGLINPLVAAIVMPVSSLTVLLSTLAGTKKMRSLWKS